MVQRQESNILIVCFKQANPFFTMENKINIIPLSREIMLFIDRVKSFYLSFTLITLVLDKV